MQPETNANAQVAQSESLLALSRQKWLWMAGRETGLLADLFHDQSVFVHMGATLTKTDEISVIESGTIHYKQADIEDASVQIVGETAVLLNKLRLIAVVGGSEVTNPFVVTEVYVRQANNWKLLSMSFTRLIEQPPA